MGRQRKSGGEFLLKTEHIEFLHQPAANIANKLLDVVMHAKPRIRVVRVLSAYATLSGVDILEAILAKVFNKEKLAHAYVSVGLDRERTTFDALNRLLQLMGKFPNLEVYMVHDRRVNYTFHPKVYNFESDSGAALLIGSSNLTKSGLESNYEINSVIQVNLRNHTERRGYDEFTESIRPYFIHSTHGWVQKLTYEVLHVLNRKGWLARRDIETKKRGLSFKLFGVGSINAKRTKVRFRKKGLSQRRPRTPQIALQLTRWDTDPRHSETQIPRDVIANGFFPKNNINLVFPGRKTTKATLSHYEYHSRLYNREILHFLQPRDGDVLILERLLPTSFRIRLISKNKISPKLLQMLTEKRGRGKRWGWL